MQGEPEQIQSAWQALLLIVVLDVSFGIGLQMLGKPIEPMTAVGMTLLALVVDGLAIWGLLLFKTVKDRLLATWTAVFGTDLLLGLVSVPAVFMATYMDKSPWLPISILFQMLLLGWGLAVRGFIYHRTFRIGIFQANALSFTLFFLTVFLATRLYPELMPAMPDNAP
jgi:hypothetical protein